MCGILYLMMKRKKNQRPYAEDTSTVVSRAITEDERGGALLLVDEDDVEKVVEPRRPVLPIDRQDDLEDDFIEDENAVEQQAMDEHRAAERIAPKKESKKIRRPEAMHDQPRVVVADPRASEHPLDELFDDEHMDYSRLDKRRSRKGLLLGIAITLTCLAFAIVGGYRVFRDVVPQSSSGDVVVEMTVSEQVASGDVVNIDIRFTNTKEVPLASADLELIYPDGFIPSSSEPESTDDRMRLFSFSDVSSGTLTEISIIGQLVGSTLEEKEFTAVVTYRPTNFNTDFQSRAVAHTTISSSTVTIQAQVPDQVSSEQAVELIFTYTNTASIPVERLRAQVTLPEGFVVDAYDPQPSRESATWFIDALQPEEQRTITVRGKFIGNSGENQEVSMDIGIEEIDGSIHPQTQYAELVIIVNPEFTLELQAPDVISADEDITVKTVLKNAADAEMKDVVLSWEIVGAISGESVHTDTIKKIQAQESKERGLVIDVNAGKQADESVRVIAKITRALLNGKEIAVSTTTEKVIRVRSLPEFAYEARYYDDALKKIGSGPVPPQVGETTTYAIDFEARTAFNALTTVTCIARLPQDVTFVSGDAAAYDELTQEVSIAFSTLAVEAVKQVRFFVSITPTAADVDHLKVLSDAMKCSAQNAFTQERIEEELPRLTTELSSDDSASGKGVVVE